MLTDESLAVPGILVAREMEVVRTMIWTERDLQDYRNQVCCNDISTSCTDCLKTKEDIAECYLDLLWDCGEDNL